MPKKTNYQATTASLFPIMESKAPSARCSDPDTSHAAARSIGFAAQRESQRNILTALAEAGPMSDEELEAELRKRGQYTTPSGVRGRRSELADMGFVVVAGKGRTATGRECIVWKAINVENFQG